MSKRVDISALLDEFEAKRLEIIEDLVRIGKPHKEASIRSGNTPSQLYWEWSFNTGRLAVDIEAYADDRKNVAGFDVTVELTPELAFLAISQKLNSTEHLVTRVFEGIEALSEVAKAVVLSETLK